MSAKIRFVLCSIAVLAIVCLSTAPLIGQQIIQQGQQIYQNQVYGTPVVHPTQPVVKTLTTSHWASAFPFGAREHDFGAVPAASVQQHVFEFKNTLDHDLHLVGVRASCGCTKPTILTPIVKPGEIARLHARYDTVKFRGERSATLSVTIKKDLPYVEYGEVQFSVRGKIRQDVVLAPGQVDFATVAVGEGSQRTMQLKYAGDTRWKILDIKSTNPNIIVEHKETRRDPSSTGFVSYELNVSLDPKQPEGLFTDSLTLVTNDIRSSQMSVSVAGRVKRLIDVAPIKLGNLDQGTEVKKRLILRGAEPFTVMEVRVGDQRIAFTKSEGQKTLHILTYTLDTSLVGSVDDMITILTDQASQPETKVPFKATIVRSIAVDR